jgi:hypothetical protein
MQNSRSWESGYQTELEEVGLSASLRDYPGTGATAGVLLTLLAMEVITGSSSNLGSVLLVE